MQRGLSVKPRLDLELGHWQTDSPDPDQTPENAASDQGLYCLLKSCKVNG